MRIIKPYSVLIYTILIFLFFSCKEKHEYSIYGRVEHLVTKEPLEGVKVAAVRGIYDFGGRTGTKEFATYTDANGDFELSFSSRDFEFFELTYSKQDYQTYFGKEGTHITESTGDIGLLTMYIPTELGYILKFRALNHNTKEVTIDAKWNRFSKEYVKATSLVSYPPNFDLEYGNNLTTIVIGEQWLKFDFDILLNDNTRIQKTDSIWLPGLPGQEERKNGEPRTIYLVEY